MKLKFKMLSVFFTLVLLSLVITSFVSFKATEEAVIDSSLKGMDAELMNTMHQIEMMHDKAASDLVLATNYPVFKEYFELPETKAGNKYDENGVIQFTEKQLELKEDLDKWTLFLQSRLPIEETCLIDETG